MPTLWRTQAVTIWEHIWMACVTVTLLIVVFDYEPRKKGLPYGD